MNMNDNRIGPSHSQSLSEQLAGDIIQSGYLNRKCIHDTGIKKSKDRSWQTLWCNLRGSSMEFFRVDSVHFRSNSDPPPRDVYPPITMKKERSVDIKNAVVELDYTSQINKDLEKRRKFLFRVMLPSSVEYIFQAPSNNLRSKWVDALRTVAIHKEDVDASVMIHSIKTARCSIKQRSRQNVHSVKRHQYNPIMASQGASGTYDEPDYVEFSIADNMVNGDDRLKLLKRRLQEKKELLRQLKRMYNVFMGGNAAALYDDTLIHQQVEPLPFKLQKHTMINTATPTVHRRMSLPDPAENEGVRMNGLAVSANEEDRRASTGGVMEVPLIMPTSPGGESISEGIETELLIDYHLVPGAKWSLLHKGETVRVISKAGSRWYRCMALRDINIEVPPMPLQLSDLSFESVGSVEGEVRVLGVNEPMNRDMEMEPTKHDNDDDDDEMEHGISLQEEDDMTAYNEEPVKQDSLVSQEEKVDEHDGSQESVNRDEAEISNEDNDMDNDVHTDVQEEIKPSSPLADNANVTPAGIKYTPTKEGSPISDDTPTNNSSEDSSEVVLRNKRKSSLERRLSYQMATEEDDFESYLNRQTELTQEKRRAKTIARSVSSPSKAARVNLQKNLGVRPNSLTAGMRSSFAVASVAIATPRESISTSSKRDSRLMALLERESNLTSYSAPLIGCIPASALKCFVEREKGSVVPLPTPSPTCVSPAPSQYSGTSMDSPANSRPVSEQLDLPSNGHTPDPAHSRDISITSEGLPTDDTVNVSITVTENYDYDEMRKSPDFDDLEPESDPIPRAFRSHSLPPAYLMVTTPPVSPVPPESEEDFGESNLDTSPSHLRQSAGWRSPEPSESEKLSPFHSSSVDSSPNHKPRPQSPNSKSKPRSMSHTPQSFGSLFEGGNSKPSLLKKLFSKNKRKKIMNDGRSEVRSPSPNPSSSLPPNLLHKTFLDDDLEPLEERSRVSSVSGRPVRKEGVAIVIGEESSSESEDENEENASPAHEPSSLPEESTLSSMTNSDLHPLAPEIITNEVRVLASVSSETTLPMTNQKPLSRSVSEHDSIQLKAMEDDVKEMKPQSSRSLKRNLALSFRKPRSITVTTTEDAKKAKVGRKSTKKRLPSEPYHVDGGQTIAGASSDAAAKVSGIFRQPPRGEVRFVHLDPQETKYGFRLQSYGRARDQGKVLQTFVQSIIPGSPSFMAGLHPGDTIVAVNGNNVKYAPVEKVVKAIQEGAKLKERIILQVEFVDGVTRLNCMQQAEEFKTKMKAKQAQLKEILEKEKKQTPPPLAVVSPHTSPQHIIRSHDLPVWADATPTFDAGPHPYRYNRHLNQVVGVHGEAIKTLECDVLVLPITSCHKPKSGNENVLLQLIRNSGDELIDELSLAKQCHVGDNIITRGYGLQAKYISHCVFGDLQESLYSCCSKALDEASQCGHKTVVFWVDGFAAIAVSPNCIIEAVRLWLQQESNSYKLDRVIFSARANLSIVEKFMHDCFPLLPFTQAVSPTPSQNENGTLESMESEQDTQTTEHSELNDEQNQEPAQTTNVLESDSQNEVSKTDISESLLGDIGGELEHRNGTATNVQHSMSKQESTVSTISVNTIELDMDDIDIGIGDSGSGMGSSESDSLKNSGSGLLDYLKNKTNTNNNSSAETDATPTRSETTPTKTAQTPPLDVRTRSHDQTSSYLSHSLPTGHLRELLQGTNEGGAYSFTHRIPQYLNPDRMESDV